MALPQDEAAAGNGALGFHAVVTSGETRMASTTPAAGPNGGAAPEQEGVVADALAYRLQAPAEGLGPGARARGRQGGGVEEVDLG